MAVPSQAGPGLAVGLALAPSHPPALRGGPWGGSGCLSPWKERGRLGRLSPAVLGVGDVSCWDFSGGGSAGWMARLIFPWSSPFSCPARRAGGESSSGPPGTLPTSLCVHEVLSTGCPRVGAVPSTGAARQPEGSAGGREVPYWMSEPVGRKFVTS